MEDSEMEYEEIKKMLIDVGVSDDVKCMGFAVVGGLYWFCSENHSGMNSRHYAIMCELIAPPINFRPSPAATGPSDDECLVYDILDVAMIGLEDMRSFTMKLMEKWDEIDRGSK